MQSQVNSSEESELSDVANNMKSSFRVRVCLQQYYTDIRSRCFILVSRSKRVRWLEQRLRKLFSIEGSFYLRSQGHLLPSSELLALLNPDDQVEVIPCKSSHDTIDGVQLVGTSTANNVNCHKSEDVILDISDIKNSTFKTNKDVEINKKKDIDLQAQNCKNILNRTLSDETEALRIERLQNSNDMEVENSTNTNLNCSETLRDVKQKALALLEEQFGETEDVSEERAGSRRTRKRVRRRKRSQPAQVTVDPGCDRSVTSESVATPDAAAHVSCEVNLDDVGYEAPLIARNNAVEPRKARVIYALENI